MSGAGWMFNSPVYIATRGRYAELLRQFARGIGALDTEDCWTGPGTYDFSAMQPGSRLVAYAERRS